MIVWATDRPDIWVIDRYKATDFHSKHNNKTLRAMAMLHQHADEDVATALNLTEEVADFLQKKYRHYRNGDREPESPASMDVFLLIECENIAHGLALANRNCCEPIVHNIECQADRC